VEVAAAKAKDEARRGLIVNGERLSATPAALTFGTVADHYVAAFPKRPHYYLAGVRSLSTVSGQRLDVVPVDAVTTADIKHVVKQWRDRPRTKSGRKGGAVAERHLLQAMRHLFTWAKEEGYVTRTPFKDAQGDPLITITTTAGRSRRLEEGEQERLLAVAEPDLADFFTAMIETGCRPGELRTLQWSEVRGDFLIVLAVKSKTRKLRRIPIMPVLRTILDRRRKGPDGLDLPETAYVFGTETGEEVSRRRLCARWLATCARAKVTDLHLHDLRAEAGSQLLEAGVPIHDVRDALGHSSTTMTSTYLRGRADSLTQAYQRRAAHRGPVASREAIRAGDKSA
jgi:integrase